MKFSVIIPVYNVAPYLRACLDSVIAAAREVEAGREEVEKVGGGGECNDKQSVVEIICVDDGSTDGCGAILDEYAERFNSSNRGPEHAPGEAEGNASAVHLHLHSPPPPPLVFRILHQKNAGVSAARNVALDIANGDWIVFVDADDVVSPNWLRVLSEIVSVRGTLDLIAYQYRSFLDVGGPCSWENVALESESRELRVATTSCSQLGYNVWCVAMRRSLIGTCRFKPYVVGEDILFLYQVAVRARGMVSINRELYGYRNRSGSVIRSKMTARKFLDHLGYHLELFSLIRDNPDKFGMPFVKVCLNRYLEGSMRDLSELKGDSAVFLRQVWRSGLEFARECKATSRFQHIRMWVISVLGNRAVEWVLLDVPMRMKMCICWLHRKGIL